MTDAKPGSKASRKETPPAPVSPGKVPKKVDVHLPGPSPRTAKAAAQNASPSSKKANSLHNRSASSVSSMKRITDDATNSPSSNKPLSAVNRKRFTTPDTVDDNASVAESSMGAGTIRRTEAERIEYFNNQPDCSNIEPHGVMCTRCNKLVNLGRKQTYAVKPWETHRKRCDQKVSSGSVFNDAASMRSDARSEVARSEAGGARSEAGGAPRTTQTERKAILEADQRAETVQPDQVFCRKCQKWIRLSSRTAYALGNWNAHQAKCADVVISSRVAMAQRKIRLVNDPQAKTFGPRTVECRICATSVALTGESDYTLTDWELHKKRCTSPSSSKAAKKPRAPRSSASTEATVVAGDAEASTSRGTKRHAEDELPVDDPDARAAIRPRKETYQPVEKDPPSMLGWFLLPFKGFLQGFKESMSEAPP
ncbi:hypothetical protein DFH07DRAFT_393142 [Mycena maculata]|uniref:Uncharacterized protein n=1 Tax=Mycena maculata TaxID=230809 RepID=A0AAD7KB04_9AGAR|nr:hypothetical protein DFH07DRAFT_393142 [Mycena maculata]